MDESKEKYAFMVTWVTHNSRVSERMIEFGVRRGEPVQLEIEDEIRIMSIIENITREDQLRIIETNICRDHVHMILVCTNMERDGIIGKMKAMTARAHNIAKGWTIPLEQQGGMPPCYPRGHRGPTQSSLWAQKYHWRDIDTESYLLNCIEYIHTNREHHNLRKSPELEAIIARITVSVDEAFNE